MNTKTIMKACTTLFRLMTGPGRTASQAALVLAVLVALVPSQVMAQNAVPLLNQPLVPTFAAPGGAAFTLTVSGTGFVSTSVVNWNGSARTTTFVSSSKLTASILATDIATVGTATVTVTNPTPGGGTSNPVTFAVVKAGVTGVFMARNDITVNNTAQAITSGDFRGIGKTDLAIANSNNSIDVLLGNGNGTFQTAVNYTFSSGFPVAIIAGDFNGDGKQDLAVLLGHTSMVAILTGNGDGTFTMGQQFSTGSNPVAVTAADVNKDGKLDLIVANFTDSTVSVLLGNGDGTFQTQHAYSTGVNPTAVAVGDFNGDGQLDLAVGNNNDGTVSILLGASGGTFPTHVDYPTSPLPTWVVTGDFNGDGKLDLAVCTASGKMSILLGAGDGTFGTSKNYVIGHNAQYAAVADMNADGKLDLATANLADNTVSLLTGVGDGTFRPQEVFPTNAGPAWLTTGDFNADGKLDYAVVDSSAGMVSLLSQTPLFVSPTVLNFPSTQGGFASSPLTVTLRNSGTTTVGISPNPPVSGANPGDFSYTTTCGSTIAAGKTCTYTVTFTPQDMGSRSGQIIIPLTAGGSVGMGLTGSSTILVTVEPNPHSFPTTLLGTQSAPFNFTFTNYSKLTVNFTPPGFKLIGLDPTDYIKTNDACGLTVAPSAKCLITMVFAPTQVGSRTAGLTVFGHFSPGNGQQTTLQNSIGTAVAVSPTKLTFGNHLVGTTSAVKTVVVKNAGSTALPFTASIQGTNFQDFAVASNSCSGTNSIPAGGSCTIGVTFTPLATGARSATLNIGDTDPTGPQIVTLTGNGE